MELDYNEPLEIQRYSKTIAGIIAVSIAAIVVAITLGFIGLSIYFEHNVQPMNVGMPLNQKYFSHQGTSEDKPSISGDSNSLYVCVAQKCELPDRFDTEKGTMEVVDGYYDKEVEIPLCLCPDNNPFEDWFVVVKATGGYHPMDNCDYTYHKFDLYQQDKIYDENGNYKTVWKKVGGYGTVVGWSLEWTEVNDKYKTADDCCTTNYYKGVVCIGCNNRGCLESNQKPDAPCGCEIDKDPFDTGFADIIPGKEVKIEVSSIWAGCHEHDQAFEIIHIL